MAACPEKIRAVRQFLRWLWINGPLGDSLIRSEWFRVYWGRSCDWAQWKRQSATEADLKLETRSGWSSFCLSFYAKFLCNYTCSFNTAHAKGHSWLVMFQFATRSNLLLSTFLFLFYFKKSSMMKKLISAGKQASIYTERAWVWRNYIQHLVLLCFANCRECEGYSQREDGLYSYCLMFAHWCRHDIHLHHKTTLRPELIWRQYIFTLRQSMFSCIGMLCIHSVLLLQSRKSVPSPLNQCWETVALSKELGGYSEEERGSPIVLSKITHHLHNKNPTIWPFISLLFEGSSCAQVCC